MPGSPSFIYKDFNKELYHKFHFKLHACFRIAPIESRAWARIKVLLLGLEGEEKMGKWVKENVKAIMFLNASLWFNMYHFFIIWDFSKELPRRNYISEQSASGRKERNICLFPACFSLSNNQDLTHWKQILLNFWVFSSAPSRLRVNLV